MNPASASLNDAIGAAIAAAIAQIHTCIPGRVESFDYRTRKASVKPLIKRPYLDGEPQALPVIPGVPVMFPWAGEASLTFPVPRGTTGTIFFTERAMEVWLSRGGDAPPGDPRKFDITDGVFIPGMAPFNVTGPAEDGESLLLKFGTAKFRMNAGKIAIGNAGAELLDVIDQLLGTLIATTVPTAVGTYPLSSVLSGQIATIRTLLGLIKGTLT